MDYQLKWASHLQNLSANISSLYRNSKHADVVLYTMDRMIGIPCHKLVLMSSSQYFAAVFERLPAVQPPVMYIMMPSELSYEAVKILRMYMYQGEARVSNEILKEVLHGGDILKIRGLYRGAEERPAPITTTTTSTATTPTPQQPPKSNINNNQKPPPKVQLKEATKRKSPARFLTIKEEPVEWTDEYPTAVKDELDIEAEVPPLPPPPDDTIAAGQFQRLSCETCNVKFEVPADWVNHVERHHHAQFTNANSILAKRRRRSDPGEGDNIAALMCDLCSTFFGSPAEWVKHIQTSHTELELALENDRRSKNGHFPDEWRDDGPSNVPIKRIPTIRNVK